MTTDLQYEQETTIQFNEGSEPAEVWSASPRFQRRMAKLGIEPWKTDKRERGAISAWYKIPKDWIKVRLPINRQFSEEQRASMGERLRKVREGRVSREGQGS